MLSLLSLVTGNARLFAYLAIFAVGFVGGMKWTKSAWEAERAELKAEEDAIQLTGNQKSREYEALRLTSESMNETMRRLEDEISKNPMPNCVISDDFMQLYSASPSAKGRSPR